MFGFIIRKEFEDLKKENKEKLEGLEHLIKHPNGEIISKFESINCVYFHYVYYIYKGVNIELFHSFVMSITEQLIKIESSNILINENKVYISLKADVCEDEKYFVVNLDKMSSVETDKDFKVQY